MITFPVSPTVGQVFGRHIWDGTAWVLLTSAVIPVSVGGTGAASAPQALANLGGAPVSVVAELDAHEALKSGVHGVTRQLVTYEAVVPGLISGNLLTGGATTQRSEADHFGNSNCPTTLVAGGGADGSGCVEGTITAATAAQIRTYVLNGGAVVAGTAYTASARVFSALAGDRYMGINWHDAGLAYLSSSTGATVAAGANGTVNLSVTATAPAGAVYAVPSVNVPSGSATAGQVIRASVWCVRTSATIPSSRGVAVVGSPGYVLGIGNSACAKLRSDGRVELLLGADYDAISFTRSPSTPAAGIAMRASLNLEGIGSPNAYTRWIEAGVINNAVPKELVVSATGERYSVSTFGVTQGGAVNLTVSSGPNAGKTLILSPVLIEEFA